MAGENECRLETACRCLDLPTPQKEEWLTFTEGECSDLSSLFGSLSDPLRIRIVEILSKDPLYVCLIQHLLDGIKYSKLSYHLDILRKNGVIGSRREGNFLLYYLTPAGERISKVISGMRSPEDQTSTLP